MASGHEEEYAYALPEAMQDMLVSFLIRMAFLLGEGHKEADYTSLHR